MTNMVYLLLPVLLEELRVFLVLLEWAGVSFLGLAWLPGNMVQIRKDVIAGLTKRSTVLVYRLGK